MGSSHLNTIHPRNIERQLGGRLFVPGRLHSASRAYTTTAPWPGARRPECNQTDKVPELLRERTYRHLILPASSCDISNLAKISNVYERRRLAEQSAVRGSANYFFSPRCKSLR